MSREATLQTQQTTTSHPLSQGSILQRKCVSCGQHKTGGGTCASCQSKNGAKPLQKLPTIQTKLTVGQPNDKYEQEADRVAEQIMRMPATATIGNAGTQFRHPTIQRMCTNCEEEETLQTKEMQGSTREVTAGVTSRVQSLQGRGQPLSNRTRNFFEPRFGQDFSHIRVHTDSQSTQALNARAYTIGKNIVFRTGQYSPETNIGKRLLAHELTHTIQQTQLNSKTNILQRSVEFHHTCDATLSKGGIKKDIILSAHLRAFNVIKNTANELSKKHPTDLEEEVTPKVLAAARRNFKLTSLKTAKKLNDQENIRLWKQLFEVFERILDALPSSAYKCRCPFDVLMVTPPMRDIYLVCPKYFTELSADQQAATLIHEWAHRHGPPVVRKVFEKYCTSSKFASLSRNKLIQMPDAYMLFAWEVGGVTDLPCF